jgi:hypothetical protein
VYVKFAKKWQKLPMMLVTLVESNLTQKSVQWLEGLEQSLDFIGFVTEP